MIDGFGRLIDGMGAIGRKLQTGRVQNYLMWALAGAIIVFLVAASI
ncbi:hypothetical protein ES703_18672 [subsurface metagenome]